MVKQEKVPCPKCGELYAWNASKGRVRNHGTCQFDPAVQKKPAFRVVIAQPSNVSNVYRSNVGNEFIAQTYAAVCAPKEKDDIEEFYQQNSQRNEQIMREGKAQYDTFLEKKAADDEAMRNEKAALDAEIMAREKVEADRLLQTELDKQRFYYPQNTALSIKPTLTSCIFPVYWIDSNYGFYEIHKDTPYISKPSSPPTIRRCQKKVWCKVYWNSKFGDTTNLCVGEWEMQWAMK